MLQPVRVSVPAAPCPCPQPVCVSPHAAAAPPRCARCCHMRVNVRSPVHPSGRIHHPAARGARFFARVSRSPCAATDGGGCPLRPKKPWEASFGSIAGAGICVHHLTSILAPCASPRARPGVGGPEPYEGRGTSWPSGALPLPLPAEPVSAALGQELPNPSARSRRFPNQSGAALALLAFTLSRVLSTRPFTSFWCF